MFHAVSRFRYTRLMMALFIAALVAMGTYAAAASNTFSGTPGVGGGSQAITGFTISGLYLNPFNDDPSVIGVVDFTTDVSADEVKIQLETSSGLGSAFPCIDAGVNGVNWRCNTTAIPQVTEDVIAVHVFASRQG